MKKTYSIGLVALALTVVLALTFQSSFAWAHGGLRDIPLDSAQTKELRQLHRDLQDKRYEMMDLFAEKNPNANKARSLQKEMQDLRSKIGALWLEAALAYKQANPDWEPNFRGMGHGGHGPHGNGWEGRGHGSGMMNDGGMDY